MESYIINEEEETPLYFRGQNTYSEDFEEDSDEDSDTIDELSELEVFEFNENNYINAQMILEQESADYLSDKNEEDFDAYKSDYEYQVPLPPLLLVEEMNDPVCKLNPTTCTNFSPCILVDYIDDKLQTCGQTENVRNICQLVGTWQIDENAVLEYQSKGISLGVCMKHFNYDQKNHNTRTKQLRNPNQSEISR